MGVREARLAHGDAAMHRESRAAGRVDIGEVQAWVRPGRSRFRFRSITNRALRSQ